MWKWVSIVLGLIVLAAAGLYGYWYFLVYPQQEQAAQQYAQFHQAAEQATAQTQQDLNEAQQYGGITYNTSNTVAVSNTPPAPAPAPKPSTSMQTVMETDNDTQMQIPASWVEESNDSTGYIYMQHAAATGQPLPPLISLQKITLSDGISCDTLLQHSVTGASNSMSNFQETQIAVPGAQTSIEVSGNDSSPAVGEAVILYACTPTYFYQVEGTELSAGTVGAATAALATFKIVADN